MYDKTNQPFQVTYTSSVFIASLHVNISQHTHVRVRADIDEVTRNHMIDVIINEVVFSIHDNLSFDNRS